MRFTRLGFGLVTALLGLLTSLIVRAADEPIGYVKTASGTAFVVTAQATTPAQPGVPVFLGSRLKTGPQGSIGIRGQMREMGCDIGQGYFFGHPMPLKTALAWITNPRYRQQLAD